MSVTYCLGQGWGMLGGQRQIAGTYYLPVLMWLHERPCLKGRKQRAVGQDPVPSSGLLGHAHRRMHLYLHAHTYTTHAETTRMLIYTQEQKKALDLVVAWRKTFGGPRYLSCAFKN